MKTVAEKNGSIDVLCANAGIFPPAKLEEMTSEQWDEVVDTNLKGTFHSVKAAIPYLKTSDQGRIADLIILARSPAFPASPLRCHEAGSSASCVPPPSSWRAMASPSTLYCLATS